MKLRESNVFKPVFHSVHRSGPSLRQRPPDREPSGQRPPGQRFPRQIASRWRPLDRDPRTETPLVWMKTPPPGLTFSGGHRSGRYASNWNEYLFSTLNRMCEWTLCQLGACCFSSIKIASFSSFYSIFLSKPVTFVIVRQLWY